MTTQTYRAYGLEIQSAVELPGPIVENPSTADIQIQEADLSIPESEPDKVVRSEKARIEIYRCTDEVLISWGEFGTVRVQNGSEITVDSPTETPAEQVLSALLGPGLGLALHQRGRLVLHASTASMEQRTIGFLGYCGAGKSTLAASLCASDAKLIADDLTAVRLTSTVAKTDPGPPTFKLSPKPITEIDGSFQPIGEHGEKKIFTTDDIPDGELPLDRLYLLTFTDIDTPEVSPLSPGEQLQVLMEHHYAQGMFDPSEEVGRTFEQCAALADRVPVKRLTRPEGLDVLDKTREVIERDLATE